MNSKQQIKGLSDKIIAHKEEENEKKTAKDDLHLNSCTGEQIAREMNNISNNISIK